MESFIKSDINGIWLFTVLFFIILNKYKFSLNFRGKTCFWDGKLGTLIDGVQTHKADVLTLQISDDQMSVVTAGKSWLKV